jgi:hypothetical protein
MGWSWRLDSIHGLYWIILAMIGSIYTEYNIKILKFKHSGYVNRINNKIIT